MQVVYERCCGLDVHKDTVAACVAITVGGRVDRHKRMFGTTTREFARVVRLARRASVTHVGMGIHWGVLEAIWNILEGQFDITLVNAQHFSPYPDGRRPEGRRVALGPVAPWLTAQELRPGQPIRELRDLTRYRAMLAKNEPGSHAGYRRSSKTRTSSWHRWPPMFSASRAERRWRPSSTGESDPARARRSCTKTITGETARNFDAP